MKTRRELEIRREKLQTELREIENALRVEYGEKLQRKLEEAIAKAYWTLDMEYDPVLSAPLPDGLPADQLRACSYTFLLVDGHQSGVQAHIVGDRLFLTGNFAAMQKVMRHYTIRIVEATEKARGEVKDIQGGSRRLSERANIITRWIEEADKAGA